MVDKIKKYHYNITCSVYGEIAQLARAFGSYPKGRGFDSPSRYQGKQYLGTAFYVPERQGTKNDKFHILYYKKLYGGDFYGATMLLRE